MKINIPKIKPYKIIQSNIGDLAIFSLTIRDKINIEEKFDNNLDEVETDEYISEFVRYACHKKEVLEESQEKPPEITLKEEDIKLLTDNDLELISRIYIENNEYLFKKAIKETKKGEDGIDVNSTKYGEVIFPKNEDENYREYLLRLEVGYLKRISESFKNSFGNLTSFSKGIQESLKNTISIGEQLNKSLKAAQSFNRPSVKPIFSTPKFINEDFVVKPVKNNLIPIKEIAERLDQLVEINSESTKFMIEANKLQTRIAEEIKESNNSSTRLSKINILIALIVLVVSILSFAFSIYTVRNSNNNNTQNIEKAINELKSINERIGNNNRNFDQVREQLIILENQVDSISNKNKELEKELKILKSKKIN
jgi:hypothetical protein